jgi:uncharacterized membrane protein YdbT with pleckstrin-like domain
MSAIYAEPMAVDSWPGDPDPRPNPRPDPRPDPGPERSVLILHPHWKVLVGPVFLAVLVLAAAIAIAVVIPSGVHAGTERLVDLAIAAVLLLFVIVRPLLIWKTTTYELTSGRLRVREGIIARRGRDIPLTRISDVSFTRSLLDRLVGAGRLVVESPGEHGQITLTDIPQVERVQAILFDLVEQEQHGPTPDESPDDGY